MSSVLSSARKDPRLKLRISTSRHCRIQNLWPEALMLPVSACRQATFRCPMAAGKTQRCTSSLSPNLILVSVPQATCKAALHPNQRPDGKALGTTVGTVSTTLTWGSTGVPNRTRSGLGADQILDCSEIFSASYEPWTEPLKGSVIVG